MHLLLGGPARAWNVFLACEDKKKPWTFWDAYMSLNWCWNIVIWSRHKWKKLVTASLLLHCMHWYGCLRYWKVFFSGVFQVLHWSFLVLHSDGNVCNWIPKVIWQRMDWFWVFCWELASFVDFLFVWTEICKNCLIVALFWGHQILLMFSSRGILVCSSKMLVFFSQMILWYRLTSFRKAMQLYILSRFVVEPFFLGNSDKSLWLLLKTK